jgi:hypothetical protein
MYRVALTSFVVLVFAASLGAQSLPTENSSTTPLVRDTETGRDSVLAVKVPEMPRQKAPLVEMTGNYIVMYAARVHAIGSASWQYHENGVAGTVALSALPHFSVLGTVIEIRRHGVDLTELQGGFQLNSRGSQVNFFARGLGGEACRLAVTKAVWTAGFGVEFRVSERLWIRPVAIDYSQTRFGGIFQRTGGYSGGFTVAFGRRR